MNTLRIICYLIGIVFIYLIQSFIAWDFSLAGYFESEWGRIAFLWLFVLSVVIGELLYVYFDEYFY